MTKYNVHIYREMRLVFEGIEAESPSTDAAIAGDKLTGDADELDDCEGETLSALVDVAGDTEYEQSEMIDFESERICKAAATMLAALKDSERFISGFDDDECQDGIHARLARIRTAIAEAEAAGITPGMPETALLAALESIVDYAENEAPSLESLKDSPEAEAEAERAWRAIEVVRTAISKAKAACPSWEVDGPDIHALLAKRRQVASIWSIEDVQSIRPDLTEEQAWEVLQAAEQGHDATIGINWDVLECHAEMLFGSAPETHQAEEE